MVSLSALCVRNVRVRFAFRRVRPGRLERPAYGFEVRRSIQLSYGRNLVLTGIVERIPKRINFLMLILDTAHIQGQKAAEETANPNREWQKTSFANLIRYVPSGTYYARLRVKGKLIRKSLMTASRRSQSCGLPCPSRLV